MFTIVTLLEIAIEYYIHFHLIQDPEDDERPIEERITGLTQHIGELKMKLLQQDYKVEPLSPEVAKKAILKKSRSLDESSLELTKQLDITQRDTQALRDRVLQLKTANENLLAENRRLTGSKSPNSGLVPLITTDDSALKVYLWLAHAHLILTNLNVLITSSY